MAFRVGDQVTVEPIESDAYVLQFQRHVTVSRMVNPNVAYVRVRMTNPPDQEFGPIPTTRLLNGWRDSHGQFRRW